MVPLGFDPQPFVLFAGFCFGFASGVRYIIVLEGAVTGTYKEEQAWGPALFFFFFVVSLPSLLEGTC